MIDDGVTDTKALYKKMMEKSGARVNSYALLGGCGVAAKNLANCKS